ncbi:AAA family ATPase [Agromyces seonyuensis]|uniref:AAA domain-containing protein n=1 Tax=Agromyces seonyuensis TaxID=2662446 RepID=A0A6I4P0Z5_9MICO|nr:MoxR family ATPase [Agromyces seonyuensis]MWB97689.1 AAA domain-containing protein [Agromyces seonyuensis]
MIADAALPIGEVGAHARRIIENVERVIDGKRSSVEAALTVLLAEGHLLIEDVPGVGKTMLAKALARSVDCTVGRIQFTPDLLPSDVTGVAVFDAVARDFEFKPGPVFANLVIGDEINRASPKTQAALLECMEERQVTVDGTSHRLAEPFIVIATQNPVEMEGTYPLPEAQRDRFMARISMGYPGARDEVAMLGARAESSPIDSIGPVVSEPTLVAMIRAARGVYVSEPVKEYAVALVRGTRADRRVRLGASPRATLQLVRAAKARAAIDGRDFVIPDDLDALAIPVLAHRLVPTGRAIGAHDHDGASLTESIVRQIIGETAVPLGSPRSE